MVSHLAGNHSHIVVGDTIYAEEVGEKITCQSPGGPDRVIFHKYI
jgi:hypothetical protein